MKKLLLFFWVVMVLCGCSSSKQASTTSSIESSISPMLDTNNDNEYLNSELVKRINESIKEYNGRDENDRFINLKNGINLISVDSRVEDIQNDKIQNFTMNYKVKVNDKYSLLITKTFSEAEIYYHTSRLIYTGELLDDLEVTEILNHLKMYIENYSNLRFGSYYKENYEETKEVEGDSFTRVLTFDDGTVVNSREDIQAIYDTIFSKEESNKIVENLFAKNDISYFKEIDNHLYRWSCQCGGGDVEVLTPLLDKIISVENIDENTKRIEVCTESNFINKEELGGYYPMTIFVVNENGSWKLQKVFEYGETNIQFPDSYVEEH